VEEGYHIGGVERHVYNIAIELSRLGNKVTVITTKSPKHDKFSEVPEIEVVRVPINIRLFSSPISLGVLNIHFNKLWCLWIRILFISLSHNGFQSFIIVSNVDAFVNIF